MTKQITQKDIARMLGINRSTVTRALNGHPDISEELKGRIAELSQSLGYHRNFSAMSLTTKRTQVISVLHCHNDMYISDIHATWISLLYKMARSNGYKLRLDTVNDLPEMVASQAADGFVMFGTPEEVSFLDKLPIISTLLANTECAIVRVDCSVDVTLNAVPIDGVGGMATAVHHLLDMGHQKIAFFGDISDSFICRDRRRGYVTALNDRGIAAPQSFICNLPTWVDDIDGMSAWADTVSRWVSEGVTAIVTSSDMMAIGVIRMLGGMGLSVPGDVSVVGFDDGKAALLSEPRLTTVVQDIPAAATLAFDMLMKRIDKREDVSSRIIAAPLTVRGSTAPPARVS